MTESFDAIVLAGGGGRRLGGVDKALLDVGGSTMLDRVLDALGEARRIVCVGPVRTTSLPVIWTSEEPPGGGPVAGIAAGLDRIGGRVVAVLAVDLPLVNSATVARLVNACTGACPALATDRNGTPQPLLAAYPVDVLHSRLEALGDPVDASMKQLLDGVDYVTVDVASAARDVDTPADLQMIRDIGGD